MTRVRSSVHILRWMIRIAHETGIPGREVPTATSAEPQGRIPAAQGRNKQPGEDRSKI